MSPLKNDSFLLTTVNFYVSMAFIATFGIFMTTMVLKASHLTNPLVDSVLPGVDEGAMPMQIN